MEKKWFLRCKAYSWEICIGLIFIIIQLLHVNSGLWNDEIYTLKYFTLQPLLITLTDYHVPNNHILFNVINNGYLKLFRIDSLLTLMKSPWILRIVPFIYALGTLVGTYFITLNVSNKRGGVIALILLVTTIPYYNFVLQIRGYGLSTLLLVLLVFTSIKYLKNQQQKRLIGIGICVILLMYTTPSNLYFIGNTLLLLALFFILSLNKNRLNESVLYSTDIKRISALFFSVLGATLLGLVLYMPIFSEVFQNEYVVKGKSFQTWMLSFYFEQVMGGMLSNRWLMVLFSMGGGLFYWRKTKRVEFLMLLLILFCILPLLFPYVTGSVAPSRVFVVLSPFYCILCALGLVSFYEYGATKFKCNEQVYIFLILIYALVTFSMELHKIDQRIQVDLKEGKRSQDLYYQYYSAHYDPLQMVQLIKEAHTKSALPVFVVGCEPHGITHFLEEFHTPYTRFEYSEIIIDSLIGNVDRSLMVSNHTLPFLNKFLLQSDLVNKEVNYHNLMKLKRRSILHSMDSLFAAMDIKNNDSIGVVVDTEYPQIVQPYLRREQSFVSTEVESSKWGKLVDFSESFNDVFYIRTVESETLQSKVILDSRMHFNKVLFSNDFGRVDHYTQREFYPTPNDTNLQFLTKNTEFSKGINKVITTKKRGWTGIVSFDVQTETRCDAIAVISVIRNTKQIHWQGKPFIDFLTSQVDWNYVVIPFVLNIPLEPGDIVKVYVWNSQMQAFKIQHFNVNDF